MSDSITVIVRLLCIIADLVTAMQEAQAEIQRLRDDINRLKGFHCLPDIKPLTPPSPPGNHSSCPERH